MFNTTTITPATLTLLDSVLRRTCSASDAERATGRYDGRCDINLYGPRFSGLRFKIEGVPSPDGQVARPVLAILGELPRDWTWEVVDYSAFDRACVF